MSKVSGVYKISNISSGDFYIGSSADMDSRWYRHKNSLKISSHHNIVLQRAWNKYGADSFEFSIIEMALPENLLGREQHYIDLLNPSYNISRDASAPMRGRKHSAEALKKISLAGLGRPNTSHTPESIDKQRQTLIRNGKNKPVIAIDLQTGEIKYRFETIGDVADMGWKKSAVIRCCKGTMESYQGFGWEYEDLADKDRVIREVSASTRAKLSAGRAGKGHTPAMREALRAMKPKRMVASFDLNTGVIIKQYERTKQVREDGFSQARVVLCCQGKAHTHGGMGWKYLT